MTRLFPLLLCLLASCTPSVPPDWPLPQWEIHGAPVVYEAASLPGYASAQIRGGLCVVQWDPDRWDELSDAEKVHKITHEVEHCRIAEDGVRLDAQGEELLADCRAVAWAVRADYLPPEWEAEIAGYALDWPESDEHPPGIVRSIHIIECAERARRGQ